MNEDDLIDEHIQEVIKEVKEEEASPAPKLPQKDATFVYMVVGIVIALALFFVWNNFSNDRIMTVEELHELNLQGKLDEARGYLYKGYSFVYTNGLWHTQVQDPNNPAMYDVAIHYGAREVENVSVSGTLNESFYENRSFYITFDPYEQNLQYHTLAIGELVRSLLVAFGATPSSACTNASHPDCVGLPEIHCENATAPTLFVTNKEPTGVIMKNNCMQLQGKDEELVRAANRALLSWYSII